MLVVWSEVVSNGKGVHVLGPSLKEVKENKRVKRVVNVKLIPKGVRFTTDCIIFKRVQRSLKGNEIKVLDSSKPHVWLGIVFLDCIQKERNYFFGKCRIT